MKSIIIEAIECALYDAMRGNGCYKYKAAAALVVKCVIFLKFMKLDKTYYIHAAVSVLFCRFSVLPTLRILELQKRQLLTPFEYNLRTYVERTMGRHVFQHSR